MTRSALHTSTNELPDELNPTYMFQGINTKLLLDAAAGRISLDSLVRHELASRGVNGRGEWIGFDRAENLWRSR